MDRASRKNLPRQIHTEQSKNANGRDQSRNVSSIPCKDRDGRTKDSVFVIKDLLAFASASTLRTGQRRSVRLIWAWHQPVDVHKNDLMCKGGLCTAGLCTNDTLLSMHVQCQDHTRDIDSTLGNRGSLSLARHPHHVHDSTSEAQS